MAHETTSTKQQAVRLTANAKRAMEAFHAGYLGRGYPGYKIIASIGDDPQRLFFYNLSCTMDGDEVIEVDIDYDREDPTIPHMPRGGFAYALIERLLDKGLIEKFVLQSCFHPGYLLTRTGLDYCAETFGSPKATLFIYDRENDRIMKWPSTPIAVGD